MQESLPTSVTRGPAFAGRAFRLPSGRFGHLDETGAVHDLAPVDARALLQAGYTPVDGDGRQALKDALVKASGA